MMGYQRDAVAALRGVGERSRLRGGKGWGNKRTKNEDGNQRGSYARRTHSETFR